MCVCQGGLLLPLNIDFHRWSRQEDTGVPQTLSHPGTSSSEPSSPQARQALPGPESSPLQLPPPPRGLHVVPSPAPRRASQTSSCGNGWLSSPRAAQGPEAPRLQLPRELPFPAGQLLPRTLGETQLHRGASLFNGCGHRSPEKGSDFGPEPGLLAPNVVPPPLCHPPLFSLETVKSSFIEVPLPPFPSAPHPTLSASQVQPPVVGLDCPWAGCARVRPAPSPCPARALQAPLLPGPLIPCLGPTASDWQLVKFVKFASSPNPFER